MNWKKPGFSQIVLHSEPHCSRGTILSPILETPNLYHYVVLVQLLQRHHPAEMKPKRSSSDIISGLPENIIETILCLVPIRDAVRTSILSKKWRYNWNQIPKLVFNEEDMFEESKDKHQEEEDEVYTERKELTGKCELFYAIHQVLLMHHGSIVEFTLSMNSDNKCVEIDQIITYLSRKNTVKKLTLELNGYDDPYDVPLSIFSFHQLTDLYLQHCNLDHQPTVDGFGRLTSLFLNNVDSTEKLILHIVSKSPLLKSFSLVMSDYNYTFSRDSMCELFGYIPAIEHLYLAIQYFYLYQFKSSLPELPTPLVHLRYAHLLAECFTGQCGLPFAVFLIRSSPNLEKLKLQSFQTVDEKSGIDSLTVKEYSDIWLEHLKELELFVAHKIPELEFLKLILARSPMLKNVNILINYTIDKDAESEMLRVLSDTPRASQMVKIIVERVADPESPTDDED